MKLSKTQQEVVDVLSKNPNSEVAGIYSRSVGGNWNKELWHFRGCKGFYVTSATIRALVSKGAIRKVNDDTDWHVYRLAD